MMVMLLVHPGSTYGDVIGYRSVNCIYQRSGLSFEYLTAFPVKKVISQCILGALMVMLPVHPGCTDGDAASASRKHWW